MAHPVVRGHSQLVSNARAVRDYPEGAGTRLICCSAKGRGVYRIIFHIQESEQHVLMLRIWHGFRAARSAADVKEV